jgi:L-iditol 2-dehydrogenase
MTQGTMQALVLHAVGDLRYEQVACPEPVEGESIVRVIAAGVCGSDVPRVYHHGTYRFPLIPGHEFSGTIEEPGKGSSHPAGERVAIIPLIPCGHCAYCQVGAYGQCTSYDYLGSRRDGGFAEYVSVPERCLLALPDGLDPLEASLTEPAAVALHAVRQGDIQAGDTVAVLGSGPIGMMLAQWAKFLGAGQVLMVDIDEKKLEVARQQGLGLTFNSRGGDPVAWAQEVTHGRGVDLVVEAAGVRQTFEQSFRMARSLGRVVLMGNPAGDMTLPMATVSGILRKQLTIRGTWNSSFADLPVNEWRVVLNMLAAGRLDVRSLISHRVPLSQGVQALEMMRDQREYYSRVVLVMDPLDADTRS